MVKREKRHSIPELNTTSTADISFMLLIFFLLTTSMDSDKGLGRMMPPPEPDKQEEMQDVKKDNVLTLHLYDSMGFHRAGEMFGFDSWFVAYEMRI